jgi:hypothetical protein
MSMLRSWFGPSRDEIWRQLCQETGAQVVPGGFWQGDKVEAKHGQWTIILDTYVESAGRTAIAYTRLRAPYVNRDGFKFTIYRKGAFTDLGKWFGMQDIEIGDPQFDERFVIKGNDEKKVAALFARPRIRELLLAQPDVFFTVKEDEGWFGPHFPEGVDELCFQVVGVIKDVERLKLLYDLCAETLQHLCRIGSAYENDPQVKLS